MKRAFSFPRRALWRKRIDRWNIGYPDPELRFLPRLCNAEKNSIDVGASLGLYTAHLLTCSASVWAFEPRASAAAELTRVYAGSPVVVHNLALSDTDGEFEMTICESDLGRSTLEPENSIAGVKSTVTTRRLDSFSPSSVGFIKIDVEGYEEAVLKGGLETIKQERPNLLIEIEERHKPGATERVPRMLEELGYSSWFLLEDTWQPFGTFNISIHQRENQAPYINNFVFVPTERRNPIA